MDFSRDFDAKRWKARLSGVDMVINAVGAMTARPGETLKAIHTSAPRALFDACAAQGVQVINISALGADERAESEFHLTKAAADDRLLALIPGAVVLQPSLVYGHGGASAALFDLLASLPLIPLPGGGHQLVQPIHIEDLADAVVAIAAGAQVRGRIAVVGARPLELRDLIEQLRRAMGLGRARFVGVPMPLASVSLRIARAAGLRWASPDALRMLARGNTAEVGPVRTLLGHDPRPVKDFVRVGAGRCAGLEAQIAWLAPVLRVALAIVWLAAAWVSAAAYPLEASVAMVERTGVRGTAAVALVYAGAALDAFLGVATLVLRRRRWLWIAQMAVIIGYTAIISVWLPEFWLHPFGPVAKNIALLALIYFLYEVERRTWST